MGEKINETMSFSGPVTGAGGARSTGKSDKGQGLALTRVLWTTGEAATPQETGLLKATMS